MIYEDELLNGRWKVLKPFGRANCRNFAFFEVDDTFVETAGDSRPDQRLAVLKVARVTDLPSASLYDRRRAALSAELDRAGTLTHPALPEPLDAFEHEGETVLISASVGHAPGSHPLREKIQRFGFLQSERFRAIDRVAQYLNDLLHVTDRLWEQGFVHANLNPDHLYHLRDGVVRVTGGTAFCRVVDAKIAGDDPGLWNLTIGFQSAAHRDLVEGRASGPIDAGRVRWYTYAALALDLLWGRDLRGACYDAGNPSPALDDKMMAGLAHDFPRLVELATARRPAQDAFASSLSQLFRLLRCCLDPQGRGMPADPSTEFHGVWKDLDLTANNLKLPVDPSEIQWRLDRHWVNRGYLQGACPPFNIGDEGEFLVLDQERSIIRDGSEFGRHRVLGLSSAPKRRSEMKPFVLQTIPSFDKLLLPGDLVPGRFATWERGEQTALVFLSDWANDREYDRQPTIGQTFRALSLGRRLRPTIRPYPEPWAAVEVAGAIKVFRMLTGEGKRFTVFPRAGRFFNAQYDERPDDRIARGLAADDEHTRQAEDLLPGLMNGPGQFVTVISTSPNDVYFDLNLGHDHAVSCMIPRNLCPTDAPIIRGDEIPVRVIGVDEKLWFRWDHELDGRNIQIGAVYDGELVDHQANGPYALIRFGLLRAIGLLRHDDRRAPWGLPTFGWRIGHPVRVKVRNAQPLRGGDERYELEYAGESPALAVEETFSSSSQPISGIVVDHDAEGVRVLLSHGLPPVVEVVGLLPFRKLTKSHRQHHQSIYQRGKMINVVVDEVLPERREILLGLA